MLMVWRYFWPSLRGKVVALAVMSFAMIVVSALLISPDGNPLGSGLLSAVSVAVVFTPVLFTVRASDEVFCSLPALACEKRAVVYFFSFIFMPLLLILPGSIFVSIVCPGVEKYMLGDIASTMIGSDAAAVFLSESLLSTAAQIAVGLWAAFALRGATRVVWTTLAILGAIMLNGLAGFVMGFVAALQSAGAAEVGDTVVDGLMIAGPYLLAFWGVLFIFAIYKSSRAISRKQV